MSPPIPLYLVGGLAFGAGGFVKLDGMHEFAHLSGEIGVILLLLMLGLEYTASELVTAFGDRGRPAFLILSSTSFRARDSPCFWVGDLWGPSSWVASPISRHPESPPR